MDSTAEPRASDCPRCGANNPPGKNFCGDCGASFDPLIGGINSYLGANLKSRVDEVIKDRFKDQKTVETEIAAEIAEKLSGWAKLFGAFVALPIVLILTIMGFYGFKELSDFHKAKDEIDRKIQESKKAFDDTARQIQMNTATNAGITTTLQSSKKNADDAATQVLELQRKAKILSAQLDQLPQLTKKVDDLEVAIRDLGNQSSSLIMKDLRREGKVFGIDASHHDPSIDWNKLKEAGVSFALMRATMGADFIDPRFADYWSQSKKAGILHGSYHLFRYNADPFEQAEHFTKTFRQEPGDLPPAVDVDEYSFRSPNAQVSGLEDTKKTLDNLALFIQAVRKGTGCDPIIFTPDSFWRKFLSLSASSSFSKNPLWVLYYGRVPQVPPPWTQWTFWQFSESLELNNLPPQDFNAFNGTYIQLQAFIKQQCSHQ